MDNSSIEGFTGNEFYNLDNSDYLLDVNTITDNNIINESMNDSTCQINNNRNNTQYNTDNIQYNTDNRNNNNTQYNTDNTQYNTDNRNNTQCQINIEDTTNIQYNTDNDKLKTNSRKDTNNKIENIDILKILENDEFYDPSKNIKINNKDIDAIIHNLLFIENEFIQDIKIKNIIKINNYPNFDDIISLYFNRYNKIIDSFDMHKYLILFFNIIYILILIYIFIGWASPYNLLLYHIIISVLFLILFENKENSSPFKTLLKLLYNKDIDLLPFNYKIFKNIILVFVFISFMGLLNKKYIFFVVLQNIITKLSKFN